MVIFNIIENNLIEITVDDFSADFSFKYTNSTDNLKICDRIGHGLKRQTTCSLKGKTAESC